MCRGDKQSKDSIVILSKKIASYSPCPCFTLEIVHWWVSNLELVHMGSQVLVLLRPTCNLNCWEHITKDLPLHTWSQVPIPKYDTDTYMATLFLGWDLGLYRELGIPKRCTQLATQVLNLFCINNQGLTLMDINHILMVSWAQKLWLFLHVQTCWHEWGPVYTMDHEVVPWRSKSVDWLLNSSWDNFGLH